MTSIINDEFQLRESDHPDMTIINHSITYGGRNMIKLSKYIYVESTNSMHRSQFRTIKPLSHAKTTNPCHD